MTDPLTALAEQLEAEGFARTELGPDRENFGNRVLGFEADVRVQLVLDRSVWTIEIDGFDPDVWRAALEGTDPTDPMPLDAQAEWVRANLDAVRRAAADPATADRLDEIATARAELWFG
jgi:hypothetical protein